MAWKLTINGTDRTSLIDPLSPPEISWPLNDRATAGFTCKPTLQPDRFQEVIIYAQDGTTPLFGGVILKRVASGTAGKLSVMSTAIECGDFATYTDWCYTTVTYSAPVLLKDVLTDLITDHLATYGLALDVAQVDGPTLAAFTWTNKRVSDALRELSERTNYVFRVSAGKKLKMFVPGTDAAPYAITDAAPHCIDLSWADTSEPPANTVILQCGPTGTLERTQTWIANGSDTSWVTDIRSASDSIPGYVTVGGVFKTVGTGGSYEWDPLTSTLSLGTDSTPVATTTIVLVYTAVYPFTVSATSGASPVIEYLAAREDILDVAPAQEAADGLLDALNQEPLELTAVSWDHGWAPGQALTVNITPRAVNSSFTITSVGLSFSHDRHWVYSFTAIENATYQGNYLDEWRELTGGGSGAADVISAGGGSSGSATVLSSPFYLGGSRNIGSQETELGWSPIINYTTFIAPASFTGRVRVDLFALHAGIGVKARLRNVTDSTDVESSLVTSQTPTAVTIISPILAGKAYRLERRPDTINETVFAAGAGLEAA